MKLIRMAEKWRSLGSAMAALMFILTMYRNYFPRVFRGQLRRYTKKLTSYFYPYIRITFSEYEGDGFRRSKAFMAIQRYLDKNSSKQARKLKGTTAQDSESIVLSLADNEEVTDEFTGIKLWWNSSQTIAYRHPISFYPREEEKRYFTLTFHKKHREVITQTYLKHVLSEGKNIRIRERQRKLYTNNRFDSSNGHRRAMWSHITFEHPATFDTLAMEPEKKQDIIDDLINFSKAKEYYARIGKAWKRGYILYGPPGTGKSTMIAAMANLLSYDVYDLELTSVRDNTELRKLLIDTSHRSIIVVEDIDCSLDLTGQREKEKEKKKGKDDKDSPEDKMKKKMEENKSSQVTLSGLLNFIDGLWSACAGERIIVFTTNYVEKLDPALIRRGRMDKHIELSYCKFEAFKELARNYLNIESHHLFAKIENMLEETNITPADVAENLMPKSSGEGADFCLERLIEAIDKAKEDARLKAEEEEKAKAEEKERLKAEKEEQDKKKPENTENESKSTETMGKEVKENGCIANDTNG